jgi:hypothetical protein
LAAGTILELAIPLADLGVTAGDAVVFFVAVYDGAGNELERHPPNRPIDVEVPDAAFGARQWTA